jgi:hypothetical protein
VDKPFVKNAADPKQVKAAGKKVEQHRFKELNDIRVVMNTREGRDMVWKLLKHCSLMASTYDKNNSDQSYKNGKRDVAHYLVSEIIEADEELYFKMIKERKELDNV